MRVLLPAQIVAAAAVARRLARGRAREPPLAPPAVPPRATISVVIPARNEAERIAPCLEALAPDSDVREVLVVDDRSEDGTAEVAEHLGARVVRGREPPPGWVGKPWALQQGLEAAMGDVVVFLDADTRPRPGLAAALTAALEDGSDFVTAGARFVCESAGERLLHPALLATLVYRYGPQDSIPGPPTRRLLSNGQCTAARRDWLLATGGFTHAAAHVIDDAAEARALARAGHRVVFRDGSDLVEVRMGAWREWGRSIALADVTGPFTRVGDLLTVWLVLALPILRAAALRPTRLDVTLLVVRMAMTAALARSYAPRGLPFWLSPLADPAAALRLTLSTLRPARAWRGRTYDRAATPARTARR